MKVTPDEIETYRTLLTETPQRITSASRGLENAQLYHRPDAATWSANDILAHLRSCADVWGGSIITMLEQDHPTQRYISPRAYIRKTNYPNLDFHQSLQAFVEQRSQLLNRLKSLQFADWSRAATFTEPTRQREETVFSYARRIALHEKGHCDQIEARLK